MKSINNIVWSLTSPIIRRLITTQRTENYSKPLQLSPLFKKKKKGIPLKEKGSEESNDIFGAQSLRRSVLRRFRGPIRSRYHRSDDYANINDFWEQPDGFERSMQTRRNNCNRIFGGRRRAPKVYRIGGRWLLTTGQSSGDALADEHKFRPPNWPLRFSMRLKLPGNRILAAKPTPENAWNARRRGH